MSRGRAPEADVGVDERHLVAQARDAHAQVGAGGGLADAALAGGDDDDACLGHVGQAAVVALLKRRRPHAPGGLLLGWPPRLRRAASTAATRKSCSNGGAAHQGRCWLLLSALQDSARSRAPKEQKSSPAWRPAEGMLALLRSAAARRAGLKACARVKAQTLCSSGGASERDRRSASAHSCAASRRPSAALCRTPAARGVDCACGAREPHQLRGRRRSWCQSALRPADAKQRRLHFS